MRYEDILKPRSIIHFQEQEGNKGNPGEIDTGVPYKNLRLLDGQPVDCLKAAAPGYHYTLDPLLPLEPPHGDREPNSTTCGPLARHATIARPNTSILKTYPGAGQGKRPLF